MYLGLWALHNTAWAGPQSALFTFHILVLTKKKTTSQRCGRQVEELPNSTSSVSQPARRVHYPCNARQLLLLQLPRLLLAPLELVSSRRGLCTGRMRKKPNMQHTSDVDTANYIFCSACRVLAREPNCTVTLGLTHFSGTPWHSSIFRASSVVFAWCVPWRINIFRVITQFQFEPADSILMTTGSGILLRERLQDSIRDTCKNSMFYTERSL